MIVPETPQRPADEYLSATLQNARPGGQLARTAQNGTRGTRSAHCDGAEKGRRLNSPLVLNSSTLKYIRSLFRGPGGVSFSPEFHCGHTKQLSCGRLHQSTSASEDRSRNSRAKQACTCTGSMMRVGVWVRWVCVWAPASRATPSSSSRPRPARTRPPPPARRRLSGPGPSSAGC